MSAAPNSGTVVLVSEARGEFLMIEGIRRDLRRLRVRSLHVNARRTD